MKPSSSCQHLTLIVTIFWKFLGDEIWSFLGSANRIEEEEVEAHEKHINTKAKCLPTPVLCTQPENVSSLVLLIWVFWGWEEEPPKV